MKQENPNTFVRGLVGIAIGLVMLIVIFGIIESQKGRTSKTGTSVSYEIIKIVDQSHKALERPLSSYTVNEIQALPVDKKMLYSVLVPASIKRAQVKPTIKKIISDITNRDGNIDEIVIWLYSDKQLIGNMGWDVATATWAPKGELGNMTEQIAETNNRSSYETTIRIKDNLEKYLKQRAASDVRFGLSKDKRKEIFRQIVIAEDRAQTEAAQRYPFGGPSNPEVNFDKNLDLGRRLTDKYKAQVYKKYGITKETANEISGEGIYENWPFPAKSSSH